MTKDEWKETLDSWMTEELEEEKEFLLDEICADECVLTTSSSEEFHAERLADNQAKLEAVEELLAEE